RIDSLRIIIVSKGKFQELVAFSAEENDASVKNEYASVIDENVVAIERQDERIRMIRTAISQKTGLDADNPHYAPTTDPADVQSVSVQLAGRSPTVSTAATVAISELSSSTNAPAPATRNIQPVEEEEQTGVFL
ncbi:hypothetical protein BT69DRAFT_1291539, partial [Atractiella rhizophila]